MNKYFAINNLGESFYIVSLNAEDESGAVAEATVNAREFGYSTTFVTDIEGMLEIKGSIEDALLDA